MMMESTSTSKEGEEGNYENGCEVKEEGGGGGEGGETEANPSGDASPVVVAEVDVGGHRIRKLSVKSLVTAYEKKTLPEKKPIPDHITEEEWRLIRDTKIQASGKWITRDKDGNSPLTTPRSPHSRRGSNPPRMMQTAGGEGRGSSPVSARARGLSTVSSSSYGLAATLSSTWDDVPLRPAKTQQPEQPKNGSRAEEGRGDGAAGDGDEEGDSGDDTDTRARAAQTWSAGTKLQRPSSIKVSPASSTFDEWMQQSREEEHVGVATAGATPSANSSSLLSPDHSPLPTSDGAIDISSKKSAGAVTVRRKSAGGSDQEDAGKKKERTRKSKSNSGERKKKRLSKGGKSGEEISSSAKKPSASAEGKQHKRRKSRDRNADASIRTEPDDTIRSPPGDDMSAWSESDSSAPSSPPHSPHRRNAGSTPGPVRLVYEEGKGGHNNYTKINRKRSHTDNMSVEDVRPIHFASKRKSVEIDRSALAPLSLPIAVSDEDTGDESSSKTATTVATTTAPLSARKLSISSPTLEEQPMAGGSASLSRSRTAWVNLLHKVSGGRVDKELRASKREERRRIKGSGKRGMELKRHGSSGSGLVIESKTITRSDGGDMGSGIKSRGRSWGKYEGKMVTRHDSAEEDLQSAMEGASPPEHSKTGDKWLNTGVFARSISFDSATSVSGDSADESMSGSAGARFRYMTEKLKDEREQEIAGLEEQMRISEGDYARYRINFELVHRSSYQDLVHRGIVKEWNEERSPARPLLTARHLRRSSSGITPRQHRVLHDPYGDDHVQDSGDLDEDEDDGDEEHEVDDLILTDDCNSWHVERGSDRDFVMGAFPALEDDMHYALMYKKYFYEKDHTNLWASTPEFGPVIISIEDKTSWKDPETTVADGTKKHSSTLISNFNINQTIQYFENMEKEQQQQQQTTAPLHRTEQQQPNTSRPLSSAQPRERVPASSQSMSMPAVAMSGDNWSRQAAQQQQQRSSLTSARSAPGTGLAQSQSSVNVNGHAKESLTSPRRSSIPKSEKSHESRMSRVNASLRFMKFYGADSGSHEKSPPGAQGGGRTADASPESARSAREESPPTPQRRVVPEKLPSHSSMFLNKLGLSGESRTEVYRALIQTRKGVRLLFIRSGSRIKDKLKALKVACGVMGYLPEIQAMKFKAISADIRAELLKLERSFNSQNYKFGVLYVKKGQSENEMFTNVIDDSNTQWKQFLDFLGGRITLKGWKNYTGGLDVKNESTGAESVYTEFREQRIMFHVSTLLPYYPRDEQQVERKRHLGNDIVVIVFLEPGAQFTPRLMTTQFNHIYCVVQMDDLNTDVPAVRIEYAAKAGVRPFGPKLPSSQPFLLDDNFREFFFTKLINGERASLCAPVFAVKLEHTRRALMNELVSKFAPASRSK